jgi:hypothetical protein
VRLQLSLDGVELEGVHADQHFTRVFQCFGCGRAPRHFTQAIDAVIGDNFDDGAQGIGRVQTGCIKQRRVSDGNGCDIDFHDFHGAIPFLRLKMSCVCVEGLGGNMK